MLSLSEIRNVNTVEQIDFHADFPGGGLTIKSDEGVRMLGLTPNPKV